MELAFVIWAVGTLPSVASGLCFIFFIFSVVSLITWCACRVGQVMEDNENNKEVTATLTKIARNIFFVAFPIWFASLLVPDKTTAYQMLAAYGVQSVAENPKAQELAPDGVDVLQALMKKAKQELEK